MFVIYNDKCLSKEWYLSPLKYKINILDGNTKIWPAISPCIGNINNRFSVIYISSIILTYFTLFFQIFIISKNNLLFLMFIIRPVTFFLKYSWFPQDLFSQCRTTLLGWTAFIVLFLGSNLIFMSTQMITFYA